MLIYLYVKERYSLEIHKLNIRKEQVKYFVPFAVGTDEITLVFNFMTYYII